MAYQISWPYAKHPLYQSHRDQIDITGLIIFVFCETD
jgi:hypothetical protein